MTFRNRSSHHHHHRHSSEHPHPQNNMSVSTTTGTEDQPHSSDHYGSNPNNNCLENYSHSRIILTRSRSISASSSRTTTGSSNTSSSSSASSSSSSSGSDSSSSDDDSNSHTDASRASSLRSAGSRASLKRAPILTEKEFPDSPKKSMTALNFKHKHHDYAEAMKSSHSQKPSSSSHSPGSSQTRRGSVSTSTLSHKKSIKREKGSPEKRITSGSITNTNAVTKLLAARKTKAFASTSSESDTGIPMASLSSGPGPPKRIAKVSPLRKASSTGTKSTNVAIKQDSSYEKSTPGHAMDSIKSRTMNGSSGSHSAPGHSKSQVLLNRIYSPGNTSDDSDAVARHSFTSRSTNEMSKKKVAHVDPIPQQSRISSSSQNHRTSSSSHSKVPKKKELSERRRSVPLTRSHASSSSLSGTSMNSSTGSTDESGTDSSCESTRKENTLNDLKPKSPSGRKRPVTRRQRQIHSKTIPTTTFFDPSILSHHSESEPHESNLVSMWDSDFSDDPCNSLLRVPAKCSMNKTNRPKFEEESLEELEKERRCMFPGCDSQGHLSGRYPTHWMLATCPKYQGFTPEECKENAEERHKREVERKKYRCLLPHQKKPSKLSQESKNWISKISELKAKETKDGLCSEYDALLWNDALALSAGHVEAEQGEGLSYRSIAIGRYEMSCWCSSPYAAPLCHSRRIFICEFCLKPASSGTILRRHCAKCVWRHPPGDEIYRKDRLSVWEVDGKNQKSYCQNLCLLAKCFLDHKTLYLDVDPFLFYVMTLADSSGCHLVGYFSKEKNSFLNYNVSCILTLPPYQRQGFGRLLIDFSYLLTRVEGKVGSPEKPLSDLGLISYRSYWKDAVLRRMCACATGEMIVKDLSVELGVTSADLISTLQFLGMLKYWKGKHLVLKKQDVLEEYLERVRRRGETKQIDISCLRWRPYQAQTNESSS